MTCLALCPMHIVLVRTSQKTVTPSPLPPSPLPKPKPIPDLERRLDRDRQNRGHLGKPRNNFFFSEGKKA